MIKIGYKYYVMSSGESRAWFKTLREAKKYKKGIEEL